MRHHLHQTYTEEKARDVFTPSYKVALTSAEVQGHLHTRLKGTTLSKKNPRYARREKHKMRY